MTCDRCDLDPCTCPPLDDIEAKKLLELGLVLTAVDEALGEDWSEDEDIPW